MRYIVKQASIVFLFLFSFFAVLPISVFASSYGQCGYGNGSYNSGGCATTTSNSGSNSFPAAPICTDQAPGARAPWLYDAISQNGNSILLYFTQADSPVDHYALEFGTKPNEYPYGATNIGGKGTLTYLVQSLQPNTTYYFRVRAGNGCATGNWSNEISAKTKSLVSFNQLEINNLELQPVTSGSQSGSKNTPSQTTGNKVDKNKYIVNIKVLDKNQKPLKGVKVTIHSTPQEATTDANGIARFENIEEGQHKILVLYSGYQGEQSVNLSGENKELNLNFTIELKNVLASPIVMTVISVMGLVIVILTILLLRARSKK